MIEYLVIIVAIYYLTRASIEDFLTGEVNDEVSVWFIRSMFLLALILSIAYGNSSVFFYSALIAFCFFAVALVFFHFNLAGGADVSIATGIGCTLGLLDSLAYKWRFPWLPSWLYFLVIVLIIGVWFMAFTGRHTLLSRIRFIPVLTTAFLLALL